MTAERLGQHFLSDDEWRERILLAIFGLPAGLHGGIEANTRAQGRSGTAAAGGSTAGEVWIEIGAGHGEMTGFLARQGSHVVAIELDERLIRQLREAVKKLPNVTVVSGDILDLDLAALADAAWLHVTAESRAGAGGGRFHVYGNLPYYITSPILQRLFEYAGRLDSAFLMVQREVAERIAAQPGSRDYGYLSTLVQFYAQAELVLNIPSTAFSPPPKVGSALVSLRPPGARAELEIGDEQAFLNFLKGCFAQKRKTLGNNLRALLQPASAAREILAESAIPFNARAEQLSLADFARLYANCARQNAR